MRLMTKRMDSEIIMVSEFNNPIYSRTLHCLKLDSPNNTFPYPIYLIFVKIKP